MEQRFANIDVMFTWPDKLFVMLYIGMLILFLVSAVTLPSENPIFFLLFIGTLILVTVLAMMFSNAWTTILTTDEMFSDAAEQLTFTDFFLRFFPYITFFTGILGALLFYARKSESFTGGGSLDGFE